MSEAAKPLGAVLAGGAGSRLGGSKATVELAGRPLISYPLAAFAEAGIEAIVVAKADTELPALDVPSSPSRPSPATRCSASSRRSTEAGGRPVVACACDTPFVTGAVLADARRARAATAAVHDGVRLHPLIARYEPG